MHALTCDHILVYVHIYMRITHYKDTFLCHSYMYIIRKRRMRLLHMTVYVYRTLAFLRPLRCYAPPPPPPPLQREVTAKGQFLLPYTPPHLHMHTCALTSMFTLVLRCYYVVIFAKCVRLFACSLAEGCVRVVQDYDSDTAA